MSAAWSQAEGPRLDAYGGFNLVRTEQYEQRHLGCAD
jgi:hypothetical protein